MIDVDRQAVYTDLAGIVAESSAPLRFNARVVAAPPRPNKKAVRSRAADTLAHVFVPEFVPRWAYDYYVAVAKDRVAADSREQHDASLLSMRRCFDMASAAEIIAVWTPRTDAPPVTRLDRGRRS